MRTAATESRRLRQPTALVLSAVGAALCLLFLAIESPVALAIFLLECVPAMAAIALSAFSAVWLVRWFRLTPDDRAARLIAGGALGVGLLSLIVLAFGSAGLLNRAGALVLVTATGLFGLLAVIHEARTPQACEGKPEWVRRLGWLWLAVIPFLAITAAGVTLPSGVLWKDEGFGYDILEYHLAVPKAFMTDGRIHFLPNNVFSGFPLCGELLSLLMMQLRGDPIEGAFMATAVNIALSALFVAAAWWAGSAFGSAAGIVSGVTAATTGWLTYLSSIAYVEPGMLATGMTALALLLHAARAERPSVRWFVAAGLIAGLACGFKYTAVPMIAAPLAILPLFARGSRWTVRFRNAAVYALSCVVAFTPWMIRNLLSTGNPVYPLAYSVFGAKPELWDEQMEAMWQRATGSAEAEQNAAPTWQRAVERTLAEPLMGPAVFALAAIGALRRRDRWTLALLLVLLLQVACWLALTHLFARFAVVMLLPLAVLAGRSIEPGSASPSEIGNRQPEIKPQAASRKPHSRTLAALLILGAALNLYRIGRLYYDHTRAGGERINAFGQLGWFTRGEWPGTQPWGAVNRLPAGSRVMLIGEARTFYLRTPCEYAVVFSRHPLADAVRSNPEPKAVIDWLRKRGITHLLADWGEMTRLMSTYGFYADLDADLFKRLENAGLKQVAEWPLPSATLYEVPPHG
jgi:hypothetical protein